MTRLEANIEILELLSDYIEDNPDIRFGQALFNLNIVEDVYGNDYIWEDKYNEESNITLSRITK